MNTDNATIKKLRIGYEDHGILTMYIELDGGNWVQSYGGYSMAGDGKGAELLGASIAKLLKCFEIDSLDELVGKPVRVYHSNTVVHSLQHFTKDNRFSFGALIEELGLDK